MTQTTVTPGTAGIGRISNAFAAARAEGRAALMPYFTAGFPSETISEEILAAIAEAGADLIELGIPFSDPLADGPVIQHSSQVALEAGMNVAKVLALVRRLRARGVNQPVMLMGYMNPILAYGVKRYVHDVTQVGADGLIVPDLPPEEAAELEAACAEAGIALVYLAAPITPTDRLERIAEHTSGFLYLVSLTGITGPRAGLPQDVSDFVSRARQVARTPLAVGFGIGTPAQVEAIGRLADGVIVGSALIKYVGEASDPVCAAGSFVCSLRASL